MRKFSVVAKRSDNEPYTVFAWGVELIDEVEEFGYLTVTVDWTQEGESPEVKQCKRM